MTRKQREAESIAKIESFVKNSQRILEAAKSGGINYIKVKEPIKQDPFIWQAKLNGSKVDFKEVI